MTSELNIRGKLIEANGIVATHPAAIHTVKVASITCSILAVSSAASEPRSPMNSVTRCITREINPAVMEASYATALVLLRLGHFWRASLAYLAALGCLKPQECVP